MTHTSFLVVLFRSIPYNLAAMKWSLKAGMSFSVATQPRADMKQLITSGRTGSGNMFPGILLSLGLTDQITLLANLTLPLQAIDERASAVVAEVNARHIVILELITSPQFRCQRGVNPQVTTVIHNISHYRLVLLLSVHCLVIGTPQVISIIP